MPIKTAKAAAAALIALAASIAGGTAFASGGGACAPKESWQELHAPAGIAGKASLQRGARNFMNYCLGCHSLQYMRYSRIGADLGLSDEQLKNNLVLPGTTVNDYIHSPMPSKEAETWFGRAPPDLTLIARSKGADYVYQFLKTFYVDEAKSTGANNLALKDTAMPPVLAALQGPQKAVFVLEKCHEKGEEKMIRRFDRFEQSEPGRMTPEEYDGFVRDTVAFLDYAAEPARAKRQALGIWVVLFLSVFTLFAWLLKKEIWKEVH